MKGPTHIGKWNVKRKGSDMEIRSLPVATLNEIPVFHYLVSSLMCRGTINEWVYCFRDQEYRSGCMNKST